MIPTSYYGTVAEGDTYFAAKLHVKGWTSASPADKLAALRQSTQIIDRLAYKGYKNSVYELLLASPTATDEQIRAAEASQELEFPRGADTTVVEDIRIACYECADALLKGVDPEKEQEALMTRELQFADVKTVYDRSNVPNEHTAAGVPSVTAWRYLKPFLRDGLALRLIRV